MFAYNWTEVLVYTTQCKQIVQNFSATYLHKLDRFCVRSVDPVTKVIST
jgi:hypothetical protein